MQKPLKITLACLLGFLLLVVVIVALTPTLLSTGVGKRAFLGAYNTTTNHTLSIEELSLSWFGKQYLKGLSYKEASGKTTITIKELSSTSSLFALLFKKDVGQMVIDTPIVTFAPPKTANTAPPIESSRKTGKTKNNNSRQDLWFPTKGNITLVEGSLSTTTPPLSLKELSIQAELSKKETAFNISAKTTQDNTAGDLAAQGKLIGSVSQLFRFQKGGIFQLKEGTSLSLSLVLNHFPLPLLDELLGLQGNASLSTAFGNTLSLKAEWQLVPNSLTVQTKVEAPYLKGSFEGETTASHFELTSPSLFEFVVTPPFFEVLLKDTPQEKKWDLASPATTTLSIEQLSFPLHAKEQEKGKLQINASLSMKRAELLHDSDTPFSINNVEATLKATSLMAPWRIFYAGNISSPEEQGDFKGSIQFTNLFFNNDKSDTSLTTGAFVFEDVSIPLNFLELLIGEKADLSAFLGKDLSFTGKASLEKGIFSFDGAASSPLFVTDRLFLQVGEELTLLKPAIITYQITPKLLKALKIDEKTLRLPQDAVIHLRLDSLQIPLDIDRTSLNLFSRKGFEINLTFSMDSLTLLDTPFLDSIWIKDFQGKLDSRSPKILNMSFSGDIDLSQQPGKSPIFPEIIGPSSHFESRFEVILDPKGPYATTAFLALESDRLQTSLQGKISKEGIFSLVKPSKIELLISPHRLREWPFERDETILLDETTLSFTVPTLTLSLFPFNLSSFVLKGSGTLSDVKLTQEKHFAEALLDDIKLNLAIHAPKDHLKLEVTGHSLTSMREMQGKLRGSFTMTATASSFLKEGKVNVKEVQGEVDLSLSSFPIPVLDAWGEHEGNLLTLLGPALDMTLHVQYRPHQQNRAVFDFTASSEGFTTKLAFSVNGNFEILNDKTAFVKWEITPTRYHTLLHLLSQNATFPRSEFLLVNTTHLELFVEQLSCPPSPPPTIKELFCQAGIKATFHIAPMSLVNQVTREEVFFQKTEGLLSGENISEALNIALDGKFQSHDHASSFSLEASLLNLLSKEGEWNVKQGELKAELKLEDLRVSTLTGIFPMKPQMREDIRALLGHNLNASILIDISNLTGPIVANITSDTLQATLPLYLEQGTLYFTKRLEASLKLTPPLSEVLLKEVSPLLITALSSQEPIRFFIEPQNATIPLNPFTLKGVSIEKAILDLGKIEVKNGGELQELIDFLKAKEISDEGEMEAWFTPIFFSLKEGILTCKRFDMLLGKNIHIASWGTIDLIKDKVRMILGITPETMQSKFGIIGLTKKDIFQIKMRGSTSDVNLDWSNAYTRIGIIVTRTAGGGPGFLVGGLIELIGSTLGEEPTPPPTTVPFPWETGSSDTQGVPSEAPAPRTKKRGLKRLFDYLRG